jgi:sulfate permease, SulP family
VVVLGIALVALTNLEGRGVALVGPVSGGLPRPELPSLSGAAALLPAAAGIALRSFIESISAARAFAARTDPPVDANRELLALGAANLGAGLFQAFPAGGGTSQTAVNDGAGARTRLAGVVTAVMAVLTLTLLAPLLADLPQAVLGAILLVSAVGLVQLAPLRRIRAIRRRDFWLGVVALVSVLGSGCSGGSWRPCSSPCWSCSTSSTTRGSWPAIRRPACWPSGPRSGSTSPTSATSATASPP